LNHISPTLKPDASRSFTPGSESSGRTTVSPPSFAAVGTGRGKGCHVPLDVDESGAGLSKIVETKAVSKPSFS
jgi:hypothetical protein